MSSLNSNLTKLVYCALQSFAMATMAQTTPSSQALKEIAEFAASICPAPGTTSVSSSVDANIDVSAKLGVLAKKLTDIGISGSAKISNVDTSGVLQKDLVESLRDVGKCRLQATEIVRDAVFVKPTRAGYGFCPSDRYEEIAMVSRFELTAYRQFLKDEPKLTPPVHAACEKGLLLSKKIAIDSISIHESKIASVGNRLSAYDQGLQGDVIKNRAELKKIIFVIKKELGSSGS